MPVDIDKLQIEIEADSAQAGSAIDRLTASLQRLQGAIGGNTALQKTSQQVRSIAKAPSLSKLERELARVEKQAIKDGDSLVALQKKLEEMQVYRGIGNPLTNAGVDSAIKKTEAQIKELSAAVDNADAKIRSLRQSIQTATAGTSAPIQKTVQQVKAAAPAMESVSRATQTVKTNLDNASKSAKRLGDTVKKAGTSGAGGMAALGRSIKGMVVSFGIFGLLFSLTGAISDSFGRMAEENEGVNRTLSEIKTSLQYVSDALAAAIYPIVKALAPIVVTIFDAVAGILNAVARIVAFLTGEDTVLQASKSWVDYAEGVDGATGSMDDATAAAKKLHRELLGIDELNIFGNNTGGGTSGGLGDLRFEEVAVDPIDLPDIITSPEWSPNPIPAPAFETVTVPAVAGQKLESPAWSPSPVPAPAFAPLTLPAWALAPIPVPVWEEDPVLAPQVVPDPVLSGLAALEAAFATAWQNVKAGLADAQEAIGGWMTSTKSSFSDAMDHVTILVPQALESLKGGIWSFADSTAARLADWGETVKEKYNTVVTYLKTVTAPALAVAASNFSQFVANTAENIRAWGANVATNVRAALSYIPEAVAAGLTAAGESFASWINGTSTSFASWASNVIENAGKAAEGLVKNIVSGLSAAWENFKDAMSAMGEAISGWWNANKNWAAPLAAGVAIAGLTVGAVVLSGGSAAAAIPAFAALANGGVLTSPTAALVGEYPGAKRNPEIVTPQNLMYDTFREAQDTDAVVNAIMAGVQQIVRAIQDNNVEVYVDGDGTATQNRRNRMYGKTLQYI